MRELAIIGNGNVGIHLRQAFSSSGNNVNIYNARSFAGFDSNPDIVLLTVRDDAIESVASHIAATHRYFTGIVAHTAGSVPIDILRPYFRNHGVLYPLQTFSKCHLDLNYSKIPFFIEGSDVEVAATLEKLATTLSPNVFQLNSRQRMKMHIASVFACNFTNALYDISSHLLEEAGIPFSVLHPLIQETVRKIESLSPAEAQTGPAVRGDVKVISRHIEALESDHELQRLYMQISKYINPEIKPMSAHNKSDAH